MALTYWECYMHLGICFRNRLFSRLSFIFIEQITSFLLIFLHFLRILLYIVGDRVKYVGASVHIEVDNRYLTGFVISLLACDWMQCYSYLFGIFFGCIYLFSSTHKDRTTPYWNFPLHDNHGDSPGRLYLNLWNCII